MKDTPTHGIIIDANDDDKPPFRYRNFEDKHDQHADQFHVKQFHQLNWIRIGGTKRFQISFQDGRSPFDDCVFEADDGLAAGGVVKKYCEFNPGDPNPNRYKYTVTIGDQCDDPEIIVDPPDL